MRHRALSHQMESFGRVNSAYGRAAGPAQVAVLVQLFEGLPRRVPLIRLPANRIVQERLTRPVGLSSEVRRSYVSFCYQAGSRTKLRSSPRSEWPSRRALDPKGPGCHKTPADGPGSRERSCPVHASDTIFSSKPANRR
jgi:hypothetical protein